MSEQKRGFLTELFCKAVYDPLYNGIGWLLDKSFTMGPPIYQESEWAEPAREYDEVTTAAIIDSLQKDRGKIIHLHELYKIADALSWENGQYFISKKDTAAFLMPFSSDLSIKARDGNIESWVNREFVNERRDVYYVCIGDLLDHMEENPLPGDDWKMNTLEKKDVMFACLQERPLQLRKLIALSALLAEDARPAMESAPDLFLHREREGQAPNVTPLRPR